MIIIKKIYWYLKAVLANVYYRFPSRQLILIGVTGTDGKTSTTGMIYHVLKEAKEKTDYISTVGANIAGKNSDIGFHVTTPRFFALQKYFRKSVQNKTKYFVLEVTSHAISQLRVWGCNFKVGVLTNITNEHLDYYKSFDNYAKTKAKFINNAEMAVVNSQTPTFYRYKHLINNKNTWFTGGKNSETKYLDLVKIGLKPKFIGFEKENVLLAYTACRVLGKKPLEIVKALNTFRSVKGRFDYFEKGNYKVMIDFAHTPNSFVQLYKAIEYRYKPKRIIHVFGCAGLRDQTKREKMGTIAARGSSMVIVTEEDYRTEKIDAIFMQIEKGIKKIKSHQKNKTYFQIDSRQEAINFAFSKATPQDLILITGKAHEKSLARGRKEFLWDEYKAVEKAFTRPK